MEVCFAALGVRELGQTSSLVLIMSIGLCSMLTLPYRRLSMLLILAGVYGLLRYQPE